MNTGQGFIIEYRYGYGCTGAELCFYRVRFGDYFNYFILFGFDLFLRGLHLLRDWVISRFPRPPPIWLGIIKNNLKA